MTESFSDLWASSGPVKPQQLPLKSLVAAANNTGSNGSRGATPDTFNMLASAGSSQPNSRPITPSATKRPPPSKPTPSNAGDAFGGLVSFGGSTSRDDGLTIAERAAKAERERREQEQRQQATLKSQGSFWDQFEGNSKPQTTSAPPAKSNGGWDYDFLTPDLDFLPTASPVPAPPGKGAGEEFDDDDILGSLAKPVEEVRRASPRPTTKAPSQSSRSNQSSSSVLAPFGDGGAGEDDEDDILGSLAKPVEEVRRVSPRPTPQAPSPSPRPNQSSSPPPHVIGRIVEMGFSVEQAKIALAATESGLDVDAALEILLQNASTEPDEREPEPERDLEAEAEAERRRRRRQGPSRATVSSSSTSAHIDSSPGQQSGLQDQADKLLAQASTIGLSMFSKANAFWKEGREKVAKVYEEQRVGSAAGDVGRSTGRPRWMDESQTVEDDSGLPAENNTQSREERVPPPKPRTVPQQTHTRAQDLLFADQEPVYKSAARRRPPASASTSASASASQSKAPSRSITPAPISRPTIHVSPSARAASDTHKASGTEHFKLGRFAESEAAYSNAITALPASHLLRVPLYNNRALTRLRTGDYKGTVEDTGEVVQIITGDVGTTWHPGREAAVQEASVDLGGALGKALRRRAEAREGMEKWKEAITDWEWLSAASWVNPPLRTDAVTGAGRCRRMLSGTSASGSTPPASRPKPRPKPVPPPATAASRPSEALSRVRDANAAQEAEEQARHDLKDAVDARLATWRAGKETNLRALIASLDTVLWPALGWQKVSMAELVSPGQVKVRYTKAISKLHPDKLNVNNTDVEQRMIANGVFGTLNEAWNAFS